MATNLESAYHLCQLAHPLLKGSGTGGIVFISSVAGVTNLGTGSVYATSKGVILLVLYHDILRSKGECSLIDKRYLLFSAAINQLTKNLAC